MKELNHDAQKAGRIISEHVPIPRSFNRKCWITAQTRGTNKQQAMQNSCTEAAYHRIIQAVKTLYLKPGEMYFEKDYKAEYGTDNIVNMHCLMSSSCYLLLECDFSYDFQVKYSFDNCPFEAQVREMMKPFPLDTKATEVEKEPSYNASFAKVLKVQDEQFIHIL